jgi:hypothetical protein
MTVDFQRTVRFEMPARGIESATDGHGFEAMFLPRFGRQIGRTCLGY